MKVETGKEYQTRDGRPVRLLAVTDEPVNNNGDTVVGVVDNDVETWQSDGVYYREWGSNSSDLIEVKPKRTVWLNVYRVGLGVGHNSKADADAAFDRDDRIACIPVTFREGDGL